MEEQINRRSFDKRDHDPGSDFKLKVIDWIEMWSEKINENGAEFIKRNNCQVSKICEMVTQNMT